MTRRLALMIAASALLLPSCPGDGSGIPGTMTGGPGGIGTTLATVQTQIFSPICSVCHQPGGIGPMPLDSEAATFTNLVGVDSVEILGLKRVVAGDSESSYLIWKLEGRPTIVGDPMPLGGPPLSPAQIALIRDWIDSGANP